MNTRRRPARNTRPNFRANPADDLMRALSADPETAKVIAEAQARIQRVYVEEYDRLTAVIGAAADEALPRTAKCDRSATVDNVIHAFVRLGMVQGIKRIGARRRATRRRTA